MLGLFVAIVFIALNGFFVAAEFALVKVSTTQLAVRETNDPKVRRAQKVVGNLERYLSVTQFGITLASLGLGWIGEPAIEALVSRGLVAVTGHEVHGATHVIAIGLAFGALTFGHVLFGELVPKLVAIQRSEKTALAVAMPLHVVYVAFRPLLWVLERATKLLLGAMGMSADAASEGRLSEEEILGILVANTAKSEEARAKTELIERVIRFTKRTARHAMIPRVDVFSLPIDTPGQAVYEALRTHEYSRILLTKQRSLDEIVGYLYAKDFLLDGKPVEARDLHSMKREMMFVPETKVLIDVMREMQRANMHIAVVVDEYGGTSGIVTLEDVIEEIVGEIRDEADKEPARILAVAGEERTWDVDARATMDDLRHLGVPIQGDEHAETLGSVVLDRLGRLPRMGDKVELGQGVTAAVMSLSRRRVTSVRVHVPEERRENEPRPDDSEP